MVERTDKQPKRSLIDGAFELDKKLNRLAIVAGIGIAAVGGVLAAPAAVTIGAGLIGGSIAGLEVSKRVDAFRHSRRNKRLGKVAVAGEKRSDFTLAA